MLDWLVAQGLSTVTAHIAPGHAPSEAVASALGPAPSGQFDDDGEQIWRLEP